jgi:Immunoglobulin domain
MASLDSNGEYVCQASNMIGITKSKIYVTGVPNEISISLNHKISNFFFPVTPRPPPLPRVTVNSDVNQVFENDTIRISCKIKYPYDSTYWTFKRKYLTGTEMGNSGITLGSEYVAANHTMAIQNVTRKHAGTYTCVAKVNETEIKDSVYIEVIYEAEITDSPEESRKSP